LAIGDAIRAGDYERLALASGNAARQKSQTDVYVDALAAADALGDARKRAPRGRELTAYAAFSEFASQVRFGKDVARASRAKVWLTDIPPGKIVRYHSAALAALELAEGDKARALSLLDGAIAQHAGDPVVSELNLLKGYVALAAHDAQQAKDAFAKATGPTMVARSAYGLALAHAMNSDWEEVKKATEAVLASSSEHVGASILHARAAWETDSQAPTALPELTKITEGPLKAKASPLELANALTTRGWVLLSRDRAGEARSHFEEAVKLDPRNVWALQGLGEVRFADGLYTEALTRFEEAAKLDPLNPDAQIGAAKTKMMLEKLQDAKVLLVAAQKAFPKVAAVRVWQGRVEEALGNKKAAEENYVAAIRVVEPRQRDAVVPYTALATLLAAQGRAKDAEQKLAEARKKLPDSPALQRALGEVAAAQGNYDDAITHFKTALEQDSNDLGARFRLGVTYRRVRRVAEAEAEFERVVRADKDYPGLALERGILFEESGQVERALEQFKSALERAPGDLDLQLRVGAAYVSIGATDEALPMLKKVLEQRANSAEANHYLGRAYLRNGGLDVPIAMRYLRRAVELDPNRSDYHLYVAWGANDSNPAQLGEAKAQVEKALAIDKLNADAYWQRGVVNLRTGRVDDAIADLKRALELKPTRHEAHATLAECYEEKSDVTTAMAEWQRALSGNDKPPQWRYRYGKLLFDRGNIADAEKHLAYAVTTGAGLQPRPGWLADAEFLAAESMRKAGKKTDAIEHYKLFLQFAGPTHPDRKDATAALRAYGAKVE
jgi:tetratricopeptide (TPR) repeat protein